MKIKAFKTAPEKNKQLVAQLLSSPRDLLITVIMMNVIVNILIQNVTSSIFGDFSGWAFSVGVPLALTVIFGEVIPKSIGLANNVSISYRAAPILRSVQKVLYPLRRVLNGITTYVSRIMFFFLKRKRRSRSMSCSML